MGTEIVLDMCDLLAFRQLPGLAERQRQLALAGRPIGYFVRVN